MKELRPRKDGRTELRVLLAFDTVRRAILLVGGDKSANWAKWYVTNTLIADERFDAHQAALVTPTEQKPKEGGG